MNNFINIGSTPPEEDCLPAGHPQSRAETLVYKRQLKREFPAGSFFVKSFPHDFGTYHEVCARLDGDPDEQAAAWEAEADASPTWDDESLIDLKLVRSLS
jgi:hypothetical protein